MHASEEIPAGKQEFQNMLWLTQLIRRIVLFEANAKFDKSQPGRSTWALIHSFVVTELVTVGSLGLHARRLDADVMESEL